MGRGPRALITLGGLLGAVVALTIGVNDIAVLTIGLSGLMSAALGYRMSRLGAGALRTGYAWACCVFGATMAGQGYVALSLGLNGSGRLQAWLWIAAGAMVLAGATTSLVLRPRPA